ncbi:restriction endonuclease subunit S [Enterococcus faecium]|uniref:restriction endonuclease subunit S n=1 Tax=Enterococcus faecium TaxID=1352 RepID=UPI00298F0A8F|nr:restriction endonuclease subunit S [Enterococcus faecium]MDW7836775.1 restriction endonuclease subunit S [Enterococcus faecium]
MKYKKVKLKDIIFFNPKETIKKNQLAKKIPMDALIPFTRKVGYYEVKEFNSGTKFRNNDTLMARITPCLENGKTAYVNILNEDEIAFGSTEYFVLRADENYILPKYLYYISISDKLRNVAIKSMTGTSGRQRAQKESILDFEIELPSISIQKKVLSILDSIDSKIELNNQIISNLEELASTLFKRWFVDFEFPDENGNPYKSSGGKMDDSEFGKIPEGWEATSLSDIANYKNGLAMQKFRPDEDEESLPVLKIKELNQGFTDSNSDRCSIDISDEVKIENGDVVFSWSGTLLVKIWTGGNAGLNQHLFKVTSNKFPKWYYYLWTKFYMNKFIGIAKDKATTMGHIKRQHLNEAKVLIPSIDMLEKFGKVLGPTIDMVTEKGIENLELSNLRDSLLPKLLSGEIELPEDEEA